MINAYKSFCQIYLPLKSVDDVRLNKLSRINIAIIEKIKTMTELIISLNLEL